MQSSLAGIVGRPVYIRAHTSDGTDVDNNAFRLDQKRMHVVHNSHGSEDIHFEHFLDIGYFGVRCRHGVAYKTIDEKVEPTRICL